MTVPAIAPQPGQRAPNGDLILPMPPGVPSSQPQGAPQMPPGFPPASQPVAPPVADPRMQHFPTGPAGDPFSPVPPPIPPVQPQGQPQGLPLAAAPAPQPQAQPVNPLAQRLAGEGIPPELQGRSLGEVLSIYGNMRNIVLQGAAQGQPHGQPQRPAPQAPAPQGTSQGQQPQGWDWRNPAESIGRVVDEKLAGLQQTLQPVLQQTAQAGIKQARDQVAAEIGHSYLSIEPMILERLQGADSAALQNPQMWRLAAQSVVGELALRGQMPVVGQQPAAQPHNPWVRPAQSVPHAGAQPMPNLSGFFTEQPTHGAPSNGTPQLTQAQLFAAQQMGMSVADYLAWSGGIPTAGGRR